MPITSSRFPGDPQLLSKLPTNQRFPQPLPWIPSFARTAHRTQGKCSCLLVVYYIMKDMIKDAEEWPGGEIHKTRSGRAPSAGNSVPVELRCVGAQDRLPPNMSQ